MGLAVLLVDVPELYGHRRSVCDGPCRCCRCRNVGHYRRRPLLEEEGKLMIKITAEDLPTNVFTPENLNQMWEYVKWMLTVQMPWIMIGVAASVVVLILGVIISIFYRRDLGDEDDEEFEIRYQ